MGLPMNLSGQRTRASCAVERDAPQEPGSNLIPGVSPSTEELFQIIPTHMMNIGR